MLGKDSLDECFPIGIAAYRPGKTIFIKCGTRRYIIVDLANRQAGAHHGPFNLMLHCEHEQPLNVPDAEVKMAKQIVTANQAAIEAEFAAFEKKGL